MRLLSIFSFYRNVAALRDGRSPVGGHRPQQYSWGIINAANTASTVKQTVEQVNRLQTALDYVQKVSATVRRARMFTDLIDRQNRLNSNYLRTLEEAEDGHEGAAGHHFGRAGRGGEQRRHHLPWTGDILSSDLKMNDSERMEQLDGCLQEVRRLGRLHLGTIRQIMSYAYHQTEFGTCNGIGIWHQ